MKNIMALIRQCGLPDNMTFQSKYELLADLVRRQALEEAAKRIESTEHNYATVIRRLKDFP